jgi:hypothetical protein
MPRKNPEYSNFQAIISVDGMERTLTFKASGITGGLQVTIKSLSDGKMVEVANVSCEAKINGVNVTKISTPTNPKVFKITT